ncbi:MAG: hypothetical protein HYS27_18980 [Deltaproteobacteria bacterium]|nr:hypothetical protein [Deltaproteobacteria bacterium]
MTNEHVPGIEVNRSTEAADEALDSSIGAALPVGFRLLADEERLVITRRVRSRGLQYLTPFTILLDAAVAGFAFLIGGSPFDPEVAMMLVVYGLPIAAINYVTLAGWLNHTRVIVDGDGVRSHQRPLRLPSGAKPIARADIEQLVVEDDSFYTAGRVKMQQWRVAARVRGWQATVTLVTGLPERAQADVVVRQMSSYLGLAQ